MSVTAVEPAVSRRFPVGAEPTPQGVHFRVWAPLRSTVQVVFEDPSLPPVVLTGRDGYFTGLSEGAKAGALYRFKLDGDEKLYPDPVSRYQPQGVHGPSQVIDPSFAWTDNAWKGVSAEGQVLYEFHIGTFTQEGTWAAAAVQLPSLKDLGITCLELMPVNEFAGDSGWGYDGVDAFATYHHYGTPDDMRRFVDAAHALGIGVILDVVYNHFGPDGNYLTAFSDNYLSKKHHTDWGDAINFDGPDNGPVREFFLANALYWLTEFHLDGFRYDATQAIVDESPKHILAEITQAGRAAVAPRSIYLINENEPQQTKYVRPATQGGFGMDGMWNDDFHHAAVSAITGHNEAYYYDHLGTPQEFISGAKYGYNYQGQRYDWQQKRRGTPALDLPPTCFVHYLQNHDQIANSARGQRLDKLTGPGQLKAITTLLLLSPQTPMLFQGQEWAASSPFLYFAGHHDQLAPLIKAGRAKELSQFPSVATPAMQAALRDPSAPETVGDSKLKHDEKTKPGHAEILKLHKDLLTLRRTENVFKRVQKRGDLDGAVLGTDAFVLRFFGQTSDDDRLVLVNFGHDLTLVPAPEPLLAPPAGLRWAVQLSTEDPQYGGNGSPHPDTEQEGWFLYGRCAMVLKPAPAADAEVTARVLKRGGGSQAPILKKDIE